MARALPNDRWPDTEEVGGWWNRRNNPAIDLVGADRAPLAKHIHFVGSIKWLEQRRFDRHDYDELTRGAESVPGVTGRTARVAVSRSGFEPGLPVEQWGPDDLLAAWRAVPGHAAF